MCPTEADHGLGEPPDYGAEAELEFQGGPDDGKSFALSSDGINLGRQPDNDIVVDEPSVSRRHAFIKQVGAGYHIHDLGSTNGTFVNQQRLSSEHPLRHGDTIRLGASDVTFVFKEPTMGAQTLKVSMLEPGTSSTLISEAIVVDGKTRHVYVNGIQLDPDLPRKEFDLLLLLDSRRGEAISRDEIALAVWPERLEGDVGNHEIEQCVHRVRSRIESDTSKPIYLVTIRGYGYKLNR